MLLASTLIPALVIILFLELMIFRNFNGNLWKYLIITAVSAPCVLTGNMHLIIVAFFVIGLGTLWVYFSARLRTKDS